MAAGGYILTEFPDGATLEREAYARPLLSYYPERTVSSCLKKLGERGPQAHVPQSDV